jgi:hypothetical protein
VPRLAGQKRPESSQAKKGPKAQRIRGAAWPEVEKALSPLISDALPPILFDDAREAAAKIARFMTENCDDFGADVELMCPNQNKKIAAVLNKMLIERFRSKAQSTLDAVLV